MKLYKQPWIWILVFSVAISGSILYFKEEISNLMTGSDAVIRVNNKAVNEREFNAIFKQVEQSQAETVRAGGEELSEEKLREVAVETAVDQLLLMSFAEKKGVKVTEEDLEKFYNEIISIDSEIETKAQLFDIWEKEGFGKEEMIMQIEVYLMYDKVYNKYSNEVKITEDDIKEAYEEYFSWAMETDFSENEEVESYEEIREDLEVLVHQEKVFKKMEEDLDNFRKESNIEILI